MEQQNKVRANLFAALPKEPAKKKTDKVLHNAPELGTKISDFLELKNKIDAATAELKMIEADIKAEGKAIFIREYMKGKVRPESFKIKDETGSQCLFICMDKYTAVDENKAEILRAYELLQESYTYKINPELVERYGEVLSELIMSCPDIQEEDKAQLISGEIAYSVKKGALDMLNTFESPAEVFELINPIVSLKK